MFHEDQPRIYLEDIEGFRGYLLSASACRVDPQKERTIELLPPIRLVEMDRILNQQICTFDSNKGLCRINAEQDKPLLELDIEKATWDRSEGLRGVTPRKYVQNLRIPDAILAKLGPKQVLNLLADVGKKTGLIKNPSPRLVAEIAGLNEKISKVNNEIDSELHSRLVLGLGCIPLILTGIGLGIIIRGGHLLSAFGVSTIPAAILVVFIIAGKQLTTNPSATITTGVVFMWLGVILLTLLTFFLYRRLLRT